MTTAEKAPKVNKDQIPREITVKAGKDVEVEIPYVGKGEYCVHYCYDAVCGYWCFIVVCNDFLMFCSLILNLRFPNSLFIESQRLRKVTNIMCFPYFPEQRKVFRLYDIKF